MGTSQSLSEFDDEYCIVLDPYEEKKDCRVKLSQNPLHSVRDGEMNQNDKVIYFRYTLNLFNTDHVMTTGPCSKVVILHISQQVESCVYHSARRRHVKRAIVSLSPICQVVLW